MAKTPEFVFVLVTIIFGLVLCIMEGFKPENVPLNDYEFQNKSFPFWAYGVYSVLVIFILFSLMLIYRVYIRKRKGIKALTYVYYISKKVD